jgi:hypothetical protein
MKLASGNFIMRKLPGDAGASASAPDIGKESLGDEFVQARRKIPVSVMQQMGSQPIHRRE